MCDFLSVLRLPTKALENLIRFLSANSVAITCNKIMHKTILE